MQTKSAESLTRIRRWRLDSGLRLRELARLAKVDAGQLSRVERGDGTFGPAALARILRVLGQDELAEFLEEMGSRS